MDEDNQAVIFGQPEFKKIVINFFIACICISGSGKLFCGKCESCHSPFCRKLCGGS